MDETVKLYSKKSKLLLILGGCVLFVVSGIWIILTDPESHNVLFDNRVAEVLVGVAACLLGLAGGYFSIKTMLNKEPAILLSSAGVYDNSSAVSFGFIPWSDISDVYETSVQSSVASRQRFVVLGLFDPDKYLSKETSSWKKLILSANLKMSGSPATISSGTLGMKHDELLALISRYFRQSQNLLGGASDDVV